MNEDILTFTVGMLTGAVVVAIVLGTVFNYGFDKSTVLHGCAHYVIEDGRPVWHWLNELPEDKK